MKTYYELLSVSEAASSDEIKKAFRREIARYHPDKVQHLGREFKEMAAGIAADLTEAYRILMDPVLRAKYDEDLKDGDPAGLRATTPAPRSRRPDSPPPPVAHVSRGEPAHKGPPSKPPPRAPSTAGLDFVRRAAMSKVQRAIENIGDAAPAPASGFDAGYLIKAKKGLFKKATQGVRLLVRIVPQVDPAAVEEVWPFALKAAVPDTTLTLLLVGSGLAPKADLAAAVTDHRRRSRGAGPVLVPVDVRDWEALFPPETPDVVRALLKELHAGM